MSFVDPFSNKKFKIWNGTELPSGFEYTCDISKNTAFENLDVSLGRVFLIIS